MGRRRSKPARTVDQGELDFAPPAAPIKSARGSTRGSTKVEEAARLAIARRGQPAGGPDKVRLSLTVFLSRKRAEPLAARAIREEKNLDALVSEILEAASE